MLWHEQNNKQGERVAGHKERRRHCLVLGRRSGANKGREKRVRAAVDTCLLGEAKQGPRLER